MIKLKKPRKKSRNKPQISRFVLFSLVFFLSLFFFSYFLNIRFQGVSDAFKFSINLPASPAPTPTSEFNLGPDCALNVLGASGVNLEVISKTMQAIGIMSNPAGFAVSTVIGMIPGLGDLFGAKQCVDNPASCATDKAFETAVGLIPPPAGPLIKAGLQSCINAKEHLVITNSTLAEIKINLTSNQTTSQLNGTTKNDFDISDQFGMKEGSVVIPKGWKIEQKDGITTLTSGDKAEQGIKIGNNVYNNIKGTFTLDEKGNLKEAKLTSINITTMTFGENQPLKVPANTKITYKDGVITIEGAGKELSYGNQKIKASSTLKISKDYISGKEFIISSPFTSKPITINGDVTILSNGYLLGEKSTASVEGLKINGLFDPKTGESASLSLFFDGKEHQENNYISLDFENKKLILRSSAAGSMIHFSSSNPFINVNSDNPLNIYSIENRMEIQNREKDGLVPLINIKHLSKDYSIARFEYEKDKNIEKNADLTFKLENGNYKSTVANSMGFVASNYLGVRSDMAPMEITETDLNGKNLMGTEKNPMKLITTNFGEIYTIPLENTKISNFERLSYNIQKFTVDDLKNKFPKVNFIESGGHTNTEIKRLMDSLDYMTPEMAADLKTVYLEEGEYAKIRDKITGKISSKQPKGAGGIADEESGSISVSKYLDTKTFIHETSHIHLFEIQQTEKEENFPKESTFEQRWREVGVSYLKYIPYTPFSSEVQNPEWIGGGSEPKYGYIRPYGNQNIQEDVATFTEALALDPNYLDKYGVTNPKSPNFDVRYIKKLRLLTDGHFISPAAYVKAMKIYYNNLK